MFEIAMLVMGAYALIAGKLGSKTHQVVGWKARVIGIVMLTYLPLAFMLGIVVGIMKGASPSGDDMDVVLIVGSIALLAVTAIIAGILYNVWKQPVVHNPTMAWPQANQPTHFSNQPLDPNNPYATGGSAPPPQNPFADRQ